MPRQARGPVTSAPARPPGDLTADYVAHRGLREELSRLADAAREVNPVDVRRLAALEHHLALVLRFLAVHHRAEDSLLLPRVRDRVRYGVPAAGRALHRAADEHGAVERAMAAAGDRAVPLRLRAVDLVLLRDLVARHIHYEERQVFPLVRRHVSGAENGRRLRRVLLAGGVDAPAFLAFYLHHARPDERRRLLRQAPPGAALMWRTVWRRQYERRRDQAYHG